MLRSQRSRRRFAEPASLQASRPARRGTRQAAARHGRHPRREIICADETGRPIFIEMLRRRHPVCFVAFDLLWVNGEDLRPLPLVERKAWLRRLLRRRANHLITEALAIERRGVLRTDSGLARRADAIGILFLTGDKLQ